MRNFLLSDVHLRICLLSMIFKNTDQAADFADFVTVRLTDRLHDMSGHYSVFLSQTADDAEKPLIRHTRMPFYCRIPRMQKISG